MDKQLDTLAKSATKLSRSPLGIIALFIVFIYAFASLVVGLSSNLDAAEKMPLVWFLVIFPVLVLGVFTWLVANHHNKLYAPSDFHDDEGFIRSMTVQEQATRILREAVEVSTGPIAQGSAVALSNEAPIDGDRVSEMASYPAALPPAPPPAASLVVRVGNATEFAIREMEREFGPIIRSAILDLPNGKSELDGAMSFVNAEFTGIEVKYLHAKEPPAEVVWRLILYMDSTGEGVMQLGKYKTFRFILALVFDFELQDRKQYVEEIRKELGRCRFASLVLEFDYKDLESKYGPVRRLDARFDKSKNK